MVYLGVTGAVCVILNWVIALLVTLGSVWAIDLLFVARVEDIFCQKISNRDQARYFLTKNIFDPRR